MQSRRAQVAMAGVKSAAKGPREAMIPPFLRDLVVVSRWGLLMRSKNGRALSSRNNLISNADRYLLLTF